MYSGRKMFSLILLGFYSVPIIVGIIGTDVFIAVRAN